MRIEDMAFEGDHDDPDCNRTAGCRALLHDAECRRNPARYSTVDQDHSDAINRALAEVADRHGLCPACQEITCDDECEVGPYREVTYRRVDGADPEPSPIVEIGMEVVTVDRVDSVDPAIWRVTLKGDRRDRDTVRLPSVVFLTRTPPLAGQRMTVTIRHGEPS